ncbi:Aste57867_22038 [Aphanomyces stellatus]|uniref:Aste57867_22038 protein n=1 Tax=Aphanomyces stellatus TaxID=120398 RepID=A0A485LKH4_9STRA|nr:hypothetical protein As57867_021969 [Aphanomyces stellatus]VFT98706.1 Aste57867_22038 [Aphanomyces stellatus]
MRRRSRGPLPRRLLDPDVDRKELVVSDDEMMDMNTQVQDLVTSRKLLAALQHAKRAKAAARYHALRTEASLLDVEMVYADGFLPGVHFYKYLASVADVGASESSKEQAPGGAPTDDDGDGDGATLDEDGIPLKSMGCAKVQLKCWLPDTIIFGGSFPPVWLYSDKHGHVRKVVINFQDSHVMEKLGNRRFENDPVVVFKEPLLSKSGLAGVTTTGNNIKLYNTVELKSALSKAAGSPVTFALQKFVKPKGPKAFVVRAIYKQSRPPTGWMITNMVPFDEPTVPVLQRFCTLTAVDDGCTFAKLTERACNDVMEINHRIVKYVEGALRVTIDTFVGDFVKDDMGQWWLLQVKAFRIKSHGPGRLGVLPTKLGDAYDRSTVQDDFPEHSEVIAIDLAKRKPSDSTAAAAATDLGWKVHKMVACKFCQVLYYQHEVAYKMTMKMMYETISRIRLRSGPHVNLSFLGQTKDDLESGLLYQSWNVCSLCYALYERDQALLKVETRFNLYLGCPAKTMRDGGITIIHDANVAAKSHPLHAHVPTEFTLCRLMLFFSALYDIPKELYESETAADTRSRPKRSRLYLRFSVLGFDCFVPIHAHAMQLAPPEDNAAAAGGNRCYWIPLNIMRCFHFFAPKTPLQAKLRETSGLGAYLIDEGIITIQLIRCTDPHHVDIDPRRGHTQGRASDAPPKPDRRTHRAPILDPKSSYSVLLGSTKVQLYQFRSAFVSKTDIYTSMSSGELFNLKANVGFERIRVVQSRHITARYNLRQYYGVYVPDTSYCCNDKICTEWIDNINVVQDDGTLHVPAAGALDKFGRNQRSGSSVGSGDARGGDDELEDLVEEMLDADKRPAGLPPPRRKQTETKKVVSPSRPASPSTQRPLVNLGDDKDDDGDSVLDDLLLHDDDDLAQVTVTRRPSSVQTLSTWCITMMLHRTHNWHPPEGAVGWSAVYTLLGQVHIYAFVKRTAPQRVIDTAGERETMAVDSFGRHDDIVFDCTHKSYVRGSLDMMQAFYGAHDGICRVRLLHPATADPAAAKIVDIELGGLKECRTIDCTFNIRDAATASTEQYPPYLSVSVYVVRLTPGEVEALAARGYANPTSTPTPEGLVMLHKSSERVLTR